MRISAGIHDVFGRFQNLNLLALLHDLRSARTAHADWFSGNLLCPLAHGLNSGQQVREVNFLSQIANLKRACAYAAQCLGADYETVAHFVKSWDDNTLGAEVLIRYLEEIWSERLEDAEVVQQVINGTPLKDGQESISPICFPVMEQAKATQPKGFIHEFGK
jgi:hypothetical protein